MSNAIWITPSIQTSAKDDIVTRQILFRENEKKRVHITKQILRAKFKSMTWLVAYPRGFDGIKLTVAEMVNIEAQHAKRYWDAYFSSLGFEQYSRRGNKNTLKSVLDAVSKLISGIVLRYIIYHRMSPYHGFIHVPTDYPSLVYDLVEPYRGYIDKTVFNTVKKAQELGIEEKDWLAHAITSTEDYLDTMIYTETTRQIVSFQELLHGAVLGLRAYLLNESKRYLVPIPGNPSGGRPRKAGYRLYGRSAGPTDFWQVAESASITHKKIMSGDT